MQRAVEVMVPGIEVKNSEDSVGSVIHRDSKVHYILGVGKKKSELNLNEITHLERLKMLELYKC